jgi:SET domain
MPLADDARAIRAAADASWEQLEAVLPEKAALAAFGGRRPLRADFQWAFSMLLSRLIRLRSLGDCEALVPWADLLNHSPDSDAYLDWDAAQRAVVLRADAAAQPGQQLFASYGAKASGALLLRYPVQSYVVPSSKQVF